MRELRVILLSCACLLWVAPSAFASGGWTPVPVPSTGNNVVLSGVAAQSDSDGWAVGQQFVGAGQPQQPPVAYQWSGSAWSLTPTPQLPMYGALQGVSASSAADAWAVGFTVIGRHDRGTLVERWNGSSWSVNSLNAESGFAAGLQSVADIAPDDVWAAGEGATGGLVEHWNGSSWTAATLPDPNFIPSPDDNAISALSANDIWLAGSTLSASTMTSVPEAMHFDGRAWSVVPFVVPDENSSALNAVAAVSANNVWAAGEEQGAGAAIGGATLIEHWNGVRWKIFASPTSGAYLNLTGMTARSASDVVAVGTNEPSINGGPEHGLILRFNGTRWAIDSSDVFAGELASAATFPGAAQEWAAGVNQSSQGLVLSHP